MMVSQRIFSFFINFFINFFISFKKKHFDLFPTAQLFKWAFSFFAMISLTSCFSFLKTKEINRGENSKLQEKDYLEYLSHLNLSLLNNNQVKIKKLDGKSLKYINNLAHNLLDANELMFGLPDVMPNVQVYLIKDNRPFHFSLPGYQIFISTGILDKYIQNESYLMCLLIYELLRARFDIYQKHFAPPVHYGSVEQVVSLARIPAEEKIKLHEWSAYALTRAKLDHNIYIQWIQLHNRSYNDFNFHYQDRSLALKEELMLKKFVISQFGNKIFGNVEFKSSPEFYQFKNMIGF
ncbi:MAG: hypothetical protein QE271_06875 [Bacteriovoracaceae bacterium]|nr:hypothetical protein [Bacteriovoracaceae bacterium]